MFQTALSFLKEERLVAIFISSPSTTKENKYFHLFTIPVDLCSPTMVTGKGTVFLCLYSIWLRGGKVTTTWEEVAGSA